MLTLRRSSPRRDEVAARDRGARREVRGRWRRPRGGGGRAEEKKRGEGGRDGDVRVHRAFEPGLSACLTRPSGIPELVGFLQRMGPRWGPRVMGITWSATATASAEGADCTARRRCSETCLPRPSNKRVGQKGFPSLFAESPIRDWKSHLAHQMLFAVYIDRWAWPVQSPKKVVRKAPKQFHR